MEHCIVTPELVHLYRNGGVGTNSYYLAQFLTRKAGHQVTIFYTQEVEDLAHWKEVFKRECGARFIALNETEPIPSANTQEAHQLHLSLRVHRWLSAQSFDVIHFQHYRAAGFCALQAKRLGEAYEKTQLITIANGPSQWVNQGMERYPSGHVAEIALDYMERYCAEHCDTVVSPSRHLVDWMRASGWSLSPDVRIIPSYLPTPEPIPVPSLNPTHLVFLSRLESRKGIEIFTKAAIRFAQYLKNLPSGRCLHLSYIGRVGMVGTEKGDSYLNESLKDTAGLLSWEAHTHFGHHQAVEFCEKNPDALYVFPAEMDNFPYAVHEGAARGLHQIVSSTGGVSEFYHDAGHKFEPTPEGLFTKLREIYENGLPAAQLGFTSEQASSFRLEFIRELETRVSHARTQPLADIPQPLISVCVPHYNMGAYLPATLESLARQTYPHFEVIVVDDSSSCLRSREVFVQMQALYQSRGWKFIQQPENSGVCAARNLAARHAQGELLAFVDSDNLPLPNMLEQFQRGLHRASLDVITCNLNGFLDGESSDEKDLHLLWAFLGGCPEATVFNNTLGDANMLVRKPAFLSIGGFQPSRDEASADAVLLLRLVLAGYRLDCSNSVLFAYRRRKDGMSRLANPYWRRKPMMNAFTEGMEPWMKNLFHHKFGRPSGTLDYARTLTKLHEYREKHLREREKRRDRDRKLAEQKRKLSQLRSNPYIRLGRFLKFLKREF